MKVRLIDRYGWQRWQEAEPRLPWTMKVINERAMEPRGSFAGGNPMCKTLDPMTFILQEWRGGGLSEFAYSEDDRRLSPSEFEDTPSLHRERLLLGKLTEIRRLVDDELPLRNSVMGEVLSSVWVLEKVRGLLRGVSAQDKSEGDR